MRMNKRIWALLMAGVLGSTAVVADAESPAGKAIKYRQAVYTLVGSNFAAMGDMVKGETPWDDVVFARRASDLAAVAGLDILRGFADGSDEGRTRAKPEVWLDFADFENKLGDFVREANALNALAAGSDRTALKAQFVKTADTCKACHKEYKSKDYQGE